MASLWVLKSSGLLLLESKLARVKGQRWDEW